MRNHTRSMRTASLTAGLALALMAVLAAFGVFGAVDALMTPGDAAKTAQHISESQALFRQGIASLIDIAAAGPRPRDRLRKSWMSTVRARGATEMHVHRLAEDDASRRAIVEDLREDACA